MNLRDFLDQRERELVEEIGDHRTQLILLESELAQVRRSRQIIGPFDISAEVLERIREEGRANKAALDAAIAAGVDFLQDAPPADEETPLTRVIRPNPHENLTMKGLVKKALWEQFRGGATTRQLLDFFRDAWSRNIERTSLSPQLSRLFQDAEIGRIRSTRGWFFIPPNRINGFRPYFDRRQVIWKEPNSTTIHDEPCITREIDGLNDRVPHMRTITTVGQGLAKGIIDKREELVWLLPHEVQPDDALALRFQVSIPDDD